MLNLVLPVLLTLFLFFILKKALSRSFLEKKNSCQRLEVELKKVSRENSQLKNQNGNLERSTEETIALYDLTKDVCKTLDEDTIFKIFSERMRRYLKVSDCKYLKAGTDLTQYQADTLLPLTIQKETVGYLAAGGIKDKDRDKFYILAGQFLIGIQRAVLYQKVQELTITDSLTQVFSRRYFLERLDEEIRRSQNSKLVFSFLMADIDHFKEFNDRYGHLVGDAVLKEVTKTIKENIRQIDFIGRYGGEELSIVLPETDKQESMYVAERIRAAIESKLLVVYDEGLRVTVSIGVSTYPHDASLAKALIDKADQALYLAKQAGRNKVCAS